MALGRLLLGPRLNSVISARPPMRESLRGRTAVVAAVCALVASTAEAFVPRHDLNHATSVVLIR